MQLNIPLRNRAAQAVQIRSELEYRQAQMRLQQIENQVGIEIRNAQYAVQQNRASVDSAQAAVDLARQSLDAEQKKYQFGTSTTTLVLQYQSQLATAESTLVNATVLMKSRASNWTARPARCSIMTASASTMRPGARSRACPVCLTSHRARICLPWPSPCRRQRLRSNRSRGVASKTGAARLSQSISRALFFFLTILYNILYARVYFSRSSR